MKIITQRDLIRTVLLRWEGQYPKDDYLVTKKGGGQEACGRVRERLQKLDLEVATVAEVEEAIGNPGGASGSWVSVSCDECGSSKSMPVMKFSSGEDHSAYICSTCMLKAFALWEEKS